MTSSHSIVSRQDWLAARKQLLTRERELTRLRDELAAARRELPWERVEKTYVFQTAEGPRSLAALFGDKQQLVVYHFMFAPDWEQGCQSCSFWADNFEGIGIHLAHRDVAFTAVSRAPLPKLAAYAARMRWTFPWVSSSETDFNVDYNVSFTGADPQGKYNYDLDHRKGPENPGVSVFWKDADGAVFHTYSAYARGIEAMNGAYAILDFTPKGRDEAGLPWPMAWLERHDQYER